MIRFRALLTPVVLAARRIRSDPPLTAAVFGVVIVTSFVFAAAPRAFESNADEGLRSAVSKASPFERNIEITHAGRIEPAGQDPLAAVDAGGTRLAQRFPESVREVVGDRRDTVETTRFTAVDAPGVPGPAGTTRLMTLEYVEGAEATSASRRAACPRSATRSFPCRSGSDSRRRGSSRSPFLSSPPTSSRSRSETSSTSSPTSRMCTSGLCR